MLRFDVERYLTTCSTIQATYNDGREWVVQCVCDRERGSSRYHLYVNVYTCQAYCHRCGARCGDAVALIAHLEQCSWGEAALRAKAWSVALSEGLVRAERMVRATQGQASPSVPSVCLPDGFVAVEGLSEIPPYLVQRGVTRRMCRDHFIGVCREGYYANRVVFPIPDSEGRLATYVARWMGDPPEGVKKVLYPKGARTSQVLFNYAGASGFNHVVVCEGVFDALRVGPCAVALLGKHASQVQRGLLVALGVSRRVTILLDRDALEDAHTLARRLSVLGVRVRVARMPRARKDPGECTRAEIQRVLLRAQLVCVGAARADRLHAAIAGLLS